MLARKNRLTDSRDFKKVRESGRVSQFLNFGVAYVDRKDEKPPRFGFVVSTKISKGASDRNRIKRAMSEAVRGMAVYARQGVDVVFLAKNAATGSSTDKIMKEVRKALKEKGLVK